MTATAAVHGGRLAAAQAACPNAPTPWLDLSTGINPDPWDGPRAPASALARLPDPQALAELEAVAAAAFGVADPARVVATAGAEAGLRWVSRLLPPIPVDVVSPSYASYVAAWNLAGAPVRTIPSSEVAASTAEALILANPNNPDGTRYPREALAALVGERARAGRWTLVDEAFVEADPALSVVDLASDRLVVFRSFGKFYGLPGLRLGFVIAPPPLAERLRAAQGEWPVGGEAIAMGAAAYADVAWRTATLAALRRRADELDGLLALAGLSVVGGTCLFRLASTPDAARLFAGLCEAGVLTRPFAQRGDWLRFGLPPAEDLPRLADALSRAAP